MGRYQRADQPADQPPEPHGAGRRFPPSCPSCLQINQVRRQELVRGVSVAQIEFGLV